MNRQTLTRRNLLRGGAGLLAAGLTGACQPRLASPTAVPRLTPLPPTMPPTVSPTASKASIARPAVDGLRALADKLGVRWGSAVSGRQFNSDRRAQQLAIYARDFNMATLHSNLYWTDWEPEQSKRNPASLNAIQEQAQALKAIGITDLRGHPLMFSTLEPDWLLDGLKKGRYKKSQAIDIVKEHIRSMMTPFKGVIGEWVVVNEPFRFYEAERGDYWKIVIGESYVELAFETAREVDPQARLLLNDYDNHARGGRPVYERDNDPIERNMLLIERLKAKNLIDGLGLQMHLNAARLPEPDDLISTMRGYGLPVHITELDVNLKDIKDKSPEQRFALQADGYGAVVKAALASGVCASICLWEFGDKDSWLEDPNFSYASPDADCTPWDDDLKPKPAHQAIRDAFAARAGA